MNQQTSNAQRPTSELREPILDTILKSFPPAPVIVGVACSAQVEAKLRQHFRGTLTNELWYVPILVDNRLAFDKSEVYSNGALWRLRCMEQALADNSCPMCKGVPVEPTIQDCHGCMECDFHGTLQGYVKTQKMTMEAMEAGAAIHDDSSEGEEQ